MLSLEMEFKPKFIDYSSENSVLSNIREIFIEEDLVFAGINELCNLLFDYYKFKYEIDLDFNQFCNYFIKEIDHLYLMDIVSVVIDEASTQDGEESQLLIGLIENTSKHDRQNLTLT